MAALEADHDVGLGGKPIDDLTLALIPPLGADNNYICHSTDPYPHGGSPTAPCRVRRFRNPIRDKGTSRFRQEAPARGLVDPSVSRTAQKLRGLTCRTCGSSAPLTLKFEASCFQSRDHVSIMTGPAAGLFRRNQSITRASNDLD